jgi:site-specific DNA recombinase
MGKTYCYYQVHKETAKHYKPTRKSRKSGIEIKPYSEGVLIEGATPAIITETLFNQAQAILKKNRERSSRNGKVKYLLRGHIYCARCNRKYWGYSRWANGKPDKSNQRYYYCMGRRSIVTPIKCDNRGYQADYLEGIVWEQVEKLLSNPEFVLSELERMKNEPNQKDFLENELTEVLRRLQELDKEQERLLQWALKGFPEETVINENEKINRTRADLKERKAELEKKIEDAKENEVDLEGVERFCELARENLMNFTYEDRRLALEALQIRVAINGDSISVHGAIPVVTGDIVSTLAG